MDIYELIDRPSGHYLQEPRVQLYMYKHGAVQ